MNERLTVSVAMTTYKSKRFVKEQLESIFAQTVLPDELVICDDASPDDTVEYIEAILPIIKPKSITVVLHKNENNLGFQANFEQCLCMCKGDIVFSCDADDIWEVNKVETIKTEFQNNKVSAVFHDAILINAEGVEIGISLNAGWDTRTNKNDKIALLKLDICRKGCPYGMASAYSRELILFSIPFVHWVGHDEWLALCAPLFGNVLCLPDKLAQHRLHFWQHFREQAVIKEKAYLLQ